jgi:peptidoglycan-associated lipoprotein
MTRTLTSTLLAATLAAVLAACGGNRPPVPNPPAPPPFPDAGGRGTAPPPARPPDPPPVPEEPPSVRSTPLRPYDNTPIDVINGPDSPLKPVFFRYDSDEIDEAGKTVLAANADVLKSYPTWVITVEGHCDERGTAEYNLALGDRRAMAARNFLVSLGIPAERIRTVSYGKEFPFDPGNSESAWEKNRRAHFMLTSK